MNKNKILFTLILVIALLFVWTVAEAGSSKRRGTAGAMELLIPIGSRNMAMGGADIAGVHGVEAGYWNPAGLAHINNRGEALFSYQKWIGDINTFYAGVVVQLGQLGSLGLNLNSLDFGEINVTTTDAPDGTGETYTPQYLTLGLTYSRQMTDRINFGASFKFISENIMRESASGLAFDAGVQYAINERLRMGIAVRNIGTNMCFDGSDLEVKVQPPGSEPGAALRPLRVPLQEFEIPAQVELGLAYDVINQDIITWTVSGAFLNNNFSFDEYKLGTELVFNHMFAVRGGYVLAQNPDNDSFLSHSEEYIFGPSFGFGLNYALNASTILKLDYAYRMTKFFDSHQLITLSLGF
ncbi:MAG: PorV/PorQ family protein [Candidatus Marinimicrobia bacterium]|nr:PorV/PorQ family protein [Candidatus Neomarinimicrobiota bacterium]MDD5581896.1 PorV/PorQ family protein [Candidatus Neomarinimicrobiota bacterium]